MIANAMPPTASAPPAIRAGFFHEDSLFSGAATGFAVVGDAVADEEGEGVPVLISTGNQGVSEMAPRLSLASI